jgi:hypothetical protein
MRKFYYLISTVLLCGALSAQSFIEQNANPSPQKSAKVLKAGALLFSNTNINRTTSGIISTEFGAKPSGTRLTNAADDFIVPVGGGWSIDSIYAEGFTNLTVQPDSITVIIYDDVNGAPGTQVAFGRMMNPDPINSDSIPIKFPTPLSLSGGRYWLSIAGYYSLGDSISNARWNWATGPKRNYKEFMLQDAANQFGGFNWTEASALGLTDRSAYFDIFGTVDSMGCEQIAYDSVSLAALSSTSATILLDQEANGTFIIEYDTTGFPLGTGNRMIVPAFSNDTTFTIDSLSSGTFYDFYVIDSCSAANSSVPVGPYTFKTVVTAPYVQNFNTATFPVGWSTYSTTGEPWRLASANIGHSAPADHTTGTGFFAVVDDSENPSSSDVTLRSEFIDVSNLTTPELNFYLYSDAEDGSGVTVAGDTNATFYINLWNGSMWIDSIFLNKGNTMDTNNNVGWEQFFVNLGTYNISGPIAFEFVVDEDHSGGFDDDISLDDISVLEARTVGLTESAAPAYELNIYPNPARDHITLEMKAANNAVVQLQMVNVVGKVVLEKQVNTTNDRITLNVSDFSQGVYFIRTSIDGSNAKVHKVIIK